jgi:hypothetical protein
VQEGRLEEALALLRSLTPSDDTQVRREAQRFVAFAAGSLGAQAARKPWDLPRALELFEEACTAGEATGCQKAGRVRTFLRAPGPPP